MTKGRNQQWGVTVTFLHQELQRLQNKLSKLNVVINDGEGRRVNNKINPVCIFH